MATRRLDGRIGLARWLTASFLLLLSGTNAFSPRAVICRKSKDTSCHVIDPSMVPDLGIAVASAAAGAASQLPRIMELQAALDETKAALEESENQLAQKIHQLEDKLFVMDQEYEAQTDRFKKQYDTRMKEELEQTIAKMKVDFQYKYEVKMEEQKSKMLAERLELVNQVTGPKNGELEELRAHTQRVNRAKDKLEAALADSEAELAKMRKAASKRRLLWFLPF